MSAKTLFHVDLDAFFAAVEQLDDPSLRGRPVVVGAAPGGRGVVSTCSYEARAFGIRSAMPINEAKRLCPEAAFLPVRMARYGELSRRVMAILETFSPDVLQVSVDEAFLDMTGTEGLWGPAEAAARSIKRRVNEETGLTISLGGATSAYIAKIASGLRKPDGLVLVPPGGEAEFMRGLPLSKLWGAGEVTQARFKELGISSVGELVELGEERLRSLFGQAGGAFLFAAASGRDPGAFSRRGEARSMSAERTFERDLRDREALETLLLELSDSLYARLLAEGLGARTVTLKLRFSDFRTLTRRTSLPRQVASSAEAWGAARALLARCWDGDRPVRLLGMGFAELEAEGGAQGELFGVQGELFGQPGGAGAGAFGAGGSRAAAEGRVEAERAAKAERAVFSIERNGKGRLRRARLMGPPPPREGPY